MTLYPCRECRLAPDCDIRAAKIAGVRGLKLTSIRFACKRRVEDLPPGTHVTAELPYVWTGRMTGIGSSGEPPEPVLERRMLAAVVMKWTAGKVRIFIPEQDGGSLLASDHEKNLNTIKVTAKYLTPAGGFTPVCIHCGRPEDAEMAGWRCRFEYESSTGAENEMDCEYLEAVR